MAVDNNLERALEEVLQRLNEFAVSRNPAAVLSGKATAATNVLLESVSSGSSRSAVLQAAGLMCWFRALVLSEERQRNQQFETALELLAPVYRLRPEAVPGELHGLLADLDSSEPSHASNHVLHDSALDMLEEFQVTGDRNLLRRSIDLFRSTAAQASGTPEEGIYLSNLSFALRTSFDFTGDRETLDLAITTARRALEIRGEDPSARANTLANLGNALLELSELNGEPEPLEEGLHALRSAVEIAPVRSPDRVTALGGLGSALTRQYEITGRLKELEAAVHFQSLEVDALSDLERRPADYGLDPSAAWFNLGTGFHRLYSHSGDASYLDRAIQVLRKTLDMTPRGAPYLPWRLSNFANCLGDLFTLRGDLSNLEEAIETSRKAVDLTAEDDPSRAAVLSQLCGQLSSAYLVRGDESELAESVKVGRMAAGISRNGDPDLGTVLSNLSSALLLSYHVTGEQSLLMEAVATSREAVHATSVRDSRYTAHLSNLANALMRFADISGGSTLDEAVQVARAAVENAQVDTPTLGRYESNLSGILLMAYKRRPADHLLLEAVQMARNALVHTQDEHSELPSRMNSLAIALGLWYRHSGDTSALLESIKMARLAVTSTTDREDPVFGLHLANLAAAMHELFSYNGNKTVLALAVELGRRAVQVVSESHPLLTTVLLNIGIGLERLAEDNHSSEILAEARRVYSKCAAKGAGADITRVTAAYRWATVAMLEDRRMDAVNAVETILTLLPRVVGRSLERVEREYRLEHLPGLAYTSAGIMVAAGYVERSVEILEETRGMLFAEALEDRRDLAELRAVAPELADRLETLLRKFVAIDQDSAVLHANLLARDAVLADEI